MSEQQQDHSSEATGYDIVATQEKWRAVWEKLDPF